MKKTALAILLTMPTFLLSQQQYNFEYFWQREREQIGLSLTSGVLDATAEVMMYNYDLFDGVFDIKNHTYWNPRLSYAQKWKNGDYRQGEAFLFSSTALSFLVEGRKLVRMSQRVIWGLQAVVPAHNALRARPATQSGQGLVLTMTVAPFTDTKLFTDPWWIYVIDFVVTFGTQSLAFEISNRVYRSHLD